MPVAALVLRTTDCTGTGSSPLCPAIDAPVAALLCTPAVSSPAQRTPPPAAESSSSPSSSHRQAKLHADSAPHRTSLRRGNTRAPMKASGRRTDPQSAPRSSSLSSSARRAAAASRPRPSPTRRGSDWFPSPRRAVSGRHQGAHHGGLHHSRGIYSSSSDSLSLCGEQRRELLQRMREHEGRLRRIHMDMAAATAAHCADSEREESREGAEADVTLGSERSRADAADNESGGRHDPVAETGDSTTARVRTARRALFPEPGGSEQTDNRKPEMTDRSEGAEDRVSAAAAGSEQDWHQSGCHHSEEEHMQLVNNDALTAAPDVAQHTHSEWA